jgi:hypothetical protein
MTNLLDDDPVLFGRERARLQEHNWACAMFSWAVSELRRVKRKTSNVIAIEDALTYQLMNWEASNGPH